MITYVGYVCTEISGSYKKIATCQSGLGLIVVSFLFLGSSQQKLHRQEIREVDNLNGVLLQRWVHEPGRNNRRARENCYEELR